MNLHNSEAVEETITALEDLGRLEPIDAALVALCRSAASALDEQPGRAALVKEYRECLIALLAVGMDHDGDALADLLADIHAGAEVGDPPET